MNADEAKRLLIEFGWDAEERGRIGRMLRIIDEDAECRTAAGEYDLIRAALREVRTAQPDNGADIQTRLAESVRGFAQYGPIANWRRLSVAAVVLMAFAGGWLLKNASTTGPGRLPTISLAAADQFVPTPQEARACLSLFDELSGVFENRTGWVLLSGGRAEFGLGAAPCGAAVAPIVLRVSALGEDRLISTADLAIQPGQHAEAILPLTGGQYLRITVAAGTSPSIEPTIRAEIFLADDAAQKTRAWLESSFSLAPGHSRSAGRVETGTGGIEIRVAAAAPSSGGV